MNRFSVASTIHRAVFVNNRGTKLIRQRYYDDAVKSFTIVLNILRPLAVFVEDGNSKNNDTVTESDDDACQDCMDQRNELDTRRSGPQTPASEASTRHHSSHPSSEACWIGGRSTRRYSFSSSSSAPSQPNAQRPHSATAPTKHLSSPASSSPVAPRKPPLFVFRDPVEIPPESVPSEVSETDAEETSSELLSKFLMIVMYNLALALHLHALSIDRCDGSIRGDENARGARSERNRQRRGLFGRARKLYELAFEMNLDESCDVSLLFTLALINNLGSVYEILGETQRSETCFQNMFSTMMYLTDSNESQRNSIKEWDGLLSNALNVLFKKECEIAAPAA